MDIQIRALKPVTTSFLLSSLLLIVLAFIPGETQAARSNDMAKPSGAPVQLAWHGGGWHGGGWHGGYRRGYWRGGVWIGPAGYYNPYWTGWNGYYVRGKRCQRTCLVNRWNGAVVRCKTRCFY